MTGIRINEIPKKKPGKRFLLALGFKECGRPFEFKKRINNKQIHIKWEDKMPFGYSGYYAHVDKKPHI